MQVIGRGDDDSVGKFRLCSNLSPIEKCCVVGELKLARERSATKRLRIAHRHDAQLIGELRGIGRIDRSAIATANDNRSDSGRGGAQR